MFIDFQINTKLVIKTYIIGLVIDNLVCGRSYSQIKLAQTNDQDIFPDQCRLHQPVSLGSSSDVTVLALGWKCLATAT